MYIIKSNKAQCLKCGEIIESKSVHDFRQCQCGNLFVDGGKEYLRRGYADSQDTVKELSEYTEVQEDD